MYSIVYKRAFVGERHHSYLATSSVVACRCRDRLSCSPLLIHSETLSTFYYEPRLCRAKSWHERFDTVDTAENHVVQRKTEYQLILDWFLFSSVKEMWRWAVCFQLLEVAALATNQSRRTHGFRITRNQTVEHSNTKLGIPGHPPCNTFYSAETDLSDRQECPNGP